MKYKHIILGSNGFIASELKKKLKGKVLSINRNKKNNRNKNNFCCNFLEDCQWFKFISNNTIIYFLGYENNLYKFEKNYKHLIKSYYQFLKKLSYYLKGRSFKPLILFTSTASVYGLTNKRCNEKTKISPVSCYDSSKILIEKFLYHLSSQGICNIIIFRLSNVFGLSQTSKQKNRGFLNKAFLLKKKEDNITLFNKGKYFRDYIHIDDVVAAFLYAIKKKNLTRNKIFNVCTGRSYRIRHIIKKIIKLKKVENDIKYKIMPSNLHIIEKRNFFGSSLKLSNLTGWIPEKKIEKKLKKVIRNL